MKKAIILGASGLVGSFLLKQLLADDSYTEIVSIARKPLGITNVKLKECVGNLLQLDLFETEFKHADQLFICIGTTAKKTPNKEKYFAIDYGIPVSAAQLAKKHGVDNIAVVSAVGAYAQSKVFYTATKGKMQDDILALGLENINFLQPSIIAGPRKESRLGEGIANAVMAFFSFLIPKKYKPVQAEAIATAMIYVANHPSENIIWSNHQIKELSS